MNAAASDIVVLGATNSDYLIKGDRFPKAGDEGNLLLWDDQEIWSPKIDVPLAVAIAEGQLSEAVGHFCNAPAALTTTKLGAEPAQPGRNDVEALAKKFTAGDDESWKPFSSSAFKARASHRFTKSGFTTRTCASIAYSWSL